MTVTKVVNDTAVVAQGGSTLVVSDAPLTAAGTNRRLSPTTGVALNALSVIGNFTDANAAATAADFTATIDWGDGSPTTLGHRLRTATGASTSMSASYYANPGNLRHLVNVTDDGGSTVSADGHGHRHRPPGDRQHQELHRHRGMSTGQFVLATFTDPNTLATVSDVTRLSRSGLGRRHADDCGHHARRPADRRHPLTGRAGTIFEVLGSHTYAEETPAGLPDTLSVIITTLRRGDHHVDQPSGRRCHRPRCPADQLQRHRRSRASRGSPRALSCSDPSPTPTRAPPTPTSPAATARSSSNWGDGSAPQTLTAANLTTADSPNGVDFLIDGRSHLRRCWAVPDHHRT